MAQSSELVLHTNLLATQTHWVYQWISKEKGHMITYRSGNQLQYGMTQEMKVVECSRLWELHIMPELFVEF
jgi:hypothetical protein